MEEEFWSQLQARLNNYKQQEKKTNRNPQSWLGMHLEKLPPKIDSSPETKISKEDLVKLIKALIKCSEGFHPLKKYNTI